MGGFAAPDSDTEVGGRTRRSKNQHLVKQQNKDQVQRELDYRKLLLSDRKEYNLRNRSALIGLKSDFPFVDPFDFGGPGRYTQARVDMLEGRVEPDNPASPQKDPNRKIQRKLNKYLESKRNIVEEGYYDDWPEDIVKEFGLKVSSRK